MTHAVLRRETQRRPKDDGGLESGWDSWYDIRHYTYGTMVSAGGTSLLTGAGWTSSRAKAAHPMENSASCPRCDAIRKILLITYDISHPTFIIYRNHSLYSGILLLWSGCLIAVGDVVFSLLATLSPSSSI